MLINRRSRFASDIEINGSELGISLFCILVDGDADYFIDIYGWDVGGGVNEASFYVVMVCSHGLSLQCECFGCGGVSA